ncbi:MAG: hypothetical protein KDA44_08315 [Planctomycetales bacterium]|nr:hypothetical protein [Planctomycetales bacterium]
MSSDRWQAAARWLLAAGAILFTASAGYGHEPAAETSASVAPAEQPTADSDQLPQFGELLVVPPVGAYGRSPLHVDPVHALFVRGEWISPTPGSGIRTATGRRVTWEPLAPEGDGAWRSPALQGGYATARLDCDRPRVALLEATGHAMAYVNGQPRAGDPYGTGRMVCPVALAAGSNEFVFHAAAGELHARLIDPPQAYFLDFRDAAFPDLLAGESGPVFVSALLVNATEKPFVGGQLTTIRAGAQSITAAVPTIPPLGVLRLVIPVDGNLSPEEAAGGSVRVQVDVTLPADDGGERRLADSKAFDLAVLDPSAPHTCTFLSRIDGSVQPYAVLPAAQISAAMQGAAPPSSGPAPGVLLALHPAGVTPQHMLQGVEPLPGAHIVAPMGRRLYGFDWEDWSRTDALEALADFRQRAATDPQRTWITGVADGGHGALRLAALYPDQFAATACVDGWIDYFSYGSSMPEWTATTGVERILASCSNEQRLAPLLGNLATVGVAVHCDAAAPADLLDESRRLRAALGDFHNDFAYRVAYRDELPAGSPALAPTVTQFLVDHELPAEASVDRIEFVTPAVGVSAASRWATILAPRLPGEFCRVNAVCDDANRVIHVATENVAGLQLELSRLSPGEPVGVSIDGVSLGPLPWPTGGEKVLRFARRGDLWRELGRLPAKWKRPARSGGFRSAWDRRVALVYGTGGSPAENDWALAKARFDAEQFLVRAGGAAAVIADVDFSSAGDPHRNIVLYGNADTNSQWRELLSDSPVQTRTGQVIVGGRPESGDNLACLFVRPRPGSSTAVVAAISGTGLAGMRATDRLPLFVSGVCLPDLLLFSSDAIEAGASEIRAAGWFGLDWSVEGGEFAWREAAL